MADDPSVPTVFGWDASDYDWQRGPMDLNAAARAGIQFFTHKATEGTSTTHKNYGEAMRRARAAGIPVLGAYHVVRSTSSPAAQATHFLSYLDSQTPWWRDWPVWFLQVDLEKWPYDAVPAHLGDEFADIVVERSGRTAPIYASRGQYGNELTGTSHELWNANYGANLEGDFRDVYAARGGDSGAGWVSYSGRMPMLWQYGSRTTIGTQPICDANAFRGTLAQLVERLKGKPQLEEDVMKTVLVAIENSTDKRVWLSNFLTRIHVGDHTGNDHVNDPEQVLRDIQWLGGPGQLNMLQGTEVRFVKNLDAFGVEIPANLGDRLTALAELIGRISVPAPAPVDPAVIKAALMDPEVLAAIAVAVADEDHKRSAA